MAGDKLKKNFILITSSNFPSGGASANFLHLFCKGLKLSGHEVKVLLLKGFSFGEYGNNHKRHNVTEDGIAFSYLGFIKRSKSAFAKILDELVSLFNLVIRLLLMLPKRKKITLLIYSTEVHSNFIIFTFAKLAGIKIVTFVPEFYEKYIFEGSFLRKLKWYGFLFNFSSLNKLSTNLIVFSYYLRDKYISQGFKEANIIVQPNVTDFDYWAKDISSNKYTLGYSGSPSIKDGLHDLFKAMSILTKEGMNISLLVVGDNPFGTSLLPDLKKMCEELGIIEKVTFAGLVELDQVRKLLSQCEILTLTRPLSIQTQAGFPTKLGEYFALRKRVLVTNFGDIEKYFEKGIDLVIAESGNVTDIAEKIKWVILHKTESEIIAAEGYKTATKLLEYKAVTKRIAEILN